MQAYKGMLEASTVTVDSNGESMYPYFGKTQLNEYMESYLNQNLKKYTKKFRLKVAYRIEGTKQMCRDECREVSIILYAKINNFLNYEKEQVFVIKRGDEVWTIKL